MLVNVYSYRVMEKIVSCCCVGGSQVNLVTYKHVYLQKIIHACTCTYVIMYVYMYDVHTHHTE